MKVTRINIGSHPYSSYLQQDHFESLLRIFNLKFQNKMILEDDKIDFVVSQSSVCNSYFFRKEDTLLITSDAYGSFSSCSCFRRLSTLNMLPIQDVFCSVSHWNDKRIELFPHEDATPVDIVVRTNMKKIYLNEDGKRITITIEYHWRGPWLQELNHRWIFREKPVYFIEVEVKDEVDQLETLNIIKNIFS